MAKLSIDELDLSPSLREMVKEAAAEEGKQQAIAYIEEYRLKKELPRYMTKSQACVYAKTSFNTLTKKYIPAGLRVIIVEGQERIDQRDVDAFFEQHKK